VKILDFGLAKIALSKSEANGAGQTLTSAAVSLTEAGHVLGTAGYMSPEQVRGAAVDHRSDIFAFGAILFEMVSGQRAFKRDTAAETMTAILKEDPSELTEMNRWHLPSAGPNCASLSGEESRPAISVGPRSSLQS
jgi:eukaryotic-like serine/threonine-protein kinase